MIINLRDKENAKIEQKTCVWETHMCRYSDGQISLSGFKQPAGINLKESDCWVKKAKTIPGLEIEKRYAALFTNRKGNVAEPMCFAPM